MADSTPPQTETEYKAGRPFLFTDPKDLAMRIQNYFDECDPHIIKAQQESGYNNKGETIWKFREMMTDQVPYTVTGLARSLGVARQTLRNYRQFKHYSDDIDPAVRIELISTLEDAFQRVEEYNEMQLHKNGISNGIKFNLSNNFDWVDKQVLETNSVDDDLNALDDPAAERENVGAEAAAALAADTPKPVTPENADEQPGSPPPQ